MKYRTGCLFNPERPCPLFDLDLEVDGGLCQACVSELSQMMILTASRFTKASIITTLMIGYREKAKEIYKALMKAVDEW